MKTQRGGETRLCSKDFVLGVRSSLAFAEKKRKVCFCGGRDGFINGLSMVNLVSQYGKPSMNKKRALDEVIYSRRNVAINSERLPHNNAVTLSCPPELHLQSSRK